MSRRALFAGLCLVALLVSAGCGPLTRPGTAPAAPPAQAAPSTITATGTVVATIAPPAAGAYLGVCVPPAPFELSALDEHVARAGKGVAIVSWYQAWGPKGAPKVDAAACVAVMRRGSVPMITWEPWDPGGGPAQASYRLATIASGAYDDYIRDWARQLRALGGPVMLRPMHEMNGTWYPWSGTANGNMPADYVAAWRHMHDIFEAEGATNVTWVWSINAGNASGTTYDACYPGAKYVDWTAISGFNFGTGRPGYAWKTFADVYGPALDYLKTLGKPICVAEIGCMEAGGSKAAWLNDAYRRIRSEAAIKAVVYFDYLDRRKQLEDWRIATSDESLAAYRTAVAPPHFVATPPKELSAWVGTLSERRLRELLGLRPVY